MIDGIHATFWGAAATVSWRARGRPLLFDGNDQAKPVFDAAIRAAKSEQPDSC